MKLQPLESTEQLAFILRDAEDRRWHTQFATAVVLRKRHDAITAESMPHTWAFLLDVGDQLASQDPMVSDDPVAVKVREVSPHLIRTDWCHALRVEATCEYVGGRLETAGAFAIYAECGMEDANLGFDLGISRKLTAVQIARQCCIMLAVRVFMEIPGGDLVLV